MSELNKKYNEIMTQIDEKISNADERDFMKQKIKELTDVFVNTVDDLSAKTEEKIKQIEAKQEKIEEKMAQVESAVNEIESDIYENDEEFDFEIVCPYCNNEFMAEIDGKNEIICPECKNTIELDWNEEDSCGGHCSGCHGCGADHDDEENEDDM